MNETMHLRCPECQASFESEIQLPRSIWERSALEENTQPCPHCGAEVVLTAESVFFSGDEEPAAGSAQA